MQHYMKRPAFLVLLGSAALTEIGGLKVMVKSARKTMVLEETDAEAAVVLEERLEERSDAASTETRGSEGSCTDGKATALQKFVQGAKTTLWDTTKKEAIAFAEKKAPKADDWTLNANKRRAFFSKNKGWQAKLGDGGQFA